MAPNADRLTKVLDWLPRLFAAAAGAVAAIWGLWASWAFFIGGVVPGLGVRVEGGIIAGLGVLFIVTPLGALFYAGLAFAGWSLALWPVRWVAERMREGR